MSKEMKLQKLRVEIIHPYGYHPNGCITATVSGILWDENNNRVAVQLEYDNGYMDWIPLSEFNNSDHCVVLTGVLGDPRTEKCK